MARTHDLTRSVASVPLPPGEGGVSHFRDPEGRSYIVYAHGGILKIVRHNLNIGADVLRDVIDIDPIHVDLPSFRYDTPFMEGYATFSSGGTARTTRRYRSTDYGVNWEKTDLDLANKYKNFQVVRLFGRVFAMAAKPMTPPTAGFRWVSRAARINSTGQFVDWTAEFDTGITGTSDHADLDIRPDDALELIYLMNTGEPKRKYCIDYSMYTGHGTWHNG